MSPSGQQSFSVKGTEARLLSYIQLPLRKQTVTRQGSEVRPKQSSADLGKLESRAENPLSPSPNAAWEQKEGFFLHSSLQKGCIWRDAQREAFCLCVYSLPLCSGSPQPQFPGLGPQLSALKHQLWPTYSKEMVTPSNHQDGQRALRCCSFRAGYLSWSCSCKQGKRSTTRHIPSPEKYHIKSVQSVSIFSKDTSLDKPFGGCQSKSQKNWKKKIRQLQR